MLPKVRVGQRRNVAGHKKQAQRNRAYHKNRTKLPHSRSVPPSFLSGTILINALTVHVDFKVPPSTHLTRLAGLPGLIQTRHEMLRSASSSSRGRSNPHRVFELNDRSVL